ncbi:MAG: PDZ domain-containing protein [Synergistales bacterium]|nr:PDZ domain-containing protein [Synergistales bacterium]
MFNRLIQRVRGNQWFRRLSFKSIARNSELVERLVWGTLLILLAWTVGWSGATLLADMLERPIIEARRTGILAAPPEQQSGRENTLPLGLSKFVVKEPFGVAPHPEKEPEPRQEKPADREPEIVPLKDLLLAGTLPGVGAWVREGKGISLVLLGDTIQGYRLDEVFLTYAMLSRDNESYILHYSASGERAKGADSSGSNNDSSAQKRRAEAENENFGEQVQAPSSGQAGVVARDLVNNLLMNPMDELNKVRLVPRIEDGKPAGIEVRSLQDDSVLSALGVQPKDVVQAINGVPLRNMGDVMNAVNSMMNGSKFEVTVLRDGSPQELDYVVR